MTLLTFAAFASAAAMRVCDPMLPEIARTFGTTNGQAAGTITAFAVAYGLLQLVYGPLGDRYSKYRMITIATFACIIGSLGAAAAPYLSWLIVARVVAGATAAAIIPMSMAWIGDNVAYEERQATLARFLSGSIMGMISGQMLGGFVADTVGWRWSFVFLASIYMAIGMLLHFEIQKNPSAYEHAALGTPHPNQPPFLSQFVNLFRIKWARVILAIVFIESFVVFGSVAFVPVYLHTRFGISLTAAGAIMAVFGFGGLVYAFFARGLLARMGERGFAISGGLLLGTAFLLFFLGTSWLSAIPASFMTGLGYYMLHNTLQTNATQMAPHARGTAVSVFASAFFLGQSAGVSLGALVVDYAGAAWLFASSAIASPLVGAGFAVALRYRKTPQER